MEENFLNSTIYNWGMNFNNYFTMLKENPWLIISLIIDLSIVIFVVYKIFRYAKDSKVMQLMKGIILFIFHLHYRQEHKYCYYQYNSNPYILHSQH